MTLYGHPKIRFRMRSGLPIRSLTRVGTGLFPTVVV